MLRIALCDDNETVLNSLEKIINDWLKVEHSVSKHSSAFSLVSHIEDNIKGNLDVVVLDINLGKENGIDIAKMIKEKYPHIKVIFLTGFIEYAKDIFKTEPSYFLVKPLDKMKVIDALLKINDIIEKEKRTVLTLITKNGIVNLRTETIKYIESIERIIHVHDSSGAVFSSRSKLSDISSKLPYNFLRCHQSYIVNMDRIKSFNASSVMLYSGEVVPVSRPRFADAKCSFLKYLGGKI